MDDFSLFLETPFSFKQACKNYVDILSYRSGLTWLCSQLIKTREPVILMYHHIDQDHHSGWTDPRWTISSECFIKQMEFLSLKRRVISLQQLVHLVDQQKPIPPGTIVLTFDDGYLSTYQIAAPILANYHLPATVFLSTEVLDKETNMWVDELYSIFRYRTQNHLNFPIWKTRSIVLKTAKQIAQIYKTIAAVLIECTSYEIRQEMINDIKQQLKPFKTAPRLLMNWDEVKNLKKNYSLFNIGSHSHQHLALDILDQSQVQQDIETGLRRIEEELNDNPVTFSFPYNRISSFALETLKQNHIVAALGNLFLKSDQHPYVFQRMDAKKSQIEFQLQTLTPLQPSRMICKIKNSFL